MGICMHLTIAIGVIYLLSYRNVFAQVSGNYNIFYNDGGRSCSVKNGKLYINDAFVRNLTPQDEKELAEYQAKVDEWSANLGLRIQHQNNRNANELRKELNGIFGPDGTFHKQFKGPFWEEQNLNTPAPTTMPPLPEKDTVEIPEMPFPKPPAFCSQ